MQTKTMHDVYGIQSLFVKQDRGGFLKIKKQVGFKKYRFIRNN